MPKSKEEHRINIKGGLQMVPEDERLNALNIIIEKGGAGTSKPGLGVGLWAMLILNTVMTCVMLVAFSTNNGPIGTLMAGLGVIFWGSTLVLVYLAKKDNSSTTWAEAAYEIRDEWTAQQGASQKS